MSAALLNAAGAAVSAALRLDAMAAAMFRVKDGSGHPREVARERDGAISGLAELGLHLKSTVSFSRFDLVYARISSVAMALAFGTLGPLPAAAMARNLRVLAQGLAASSGAERPPG